MNSLLAHLYSRIKGSPEDVATMSLCYILENSATAKQVFRNYLSTISGIESFPVLYFKTQVSGVICPISLGLNRKTTFSWQ